MNSEINDAAGARKRIRVLIADDSAAFRKAFGLFLDRLPQERELTWVIAAHLGPTAGASTEGSGANS